MAYTNRFPPTSGSVKLKDHDLTKAYTQLVVHRFSVGDVEDPILYAGEPISKWQETDAGMWVTEHATDVMWVQHRNMATFGTDFAILATMSEQDASWFLLKYI